MINPSYTNADVHLFVAYGVADRFKTFFKKRLFSEEFQMCSLCSSFFSLRLLRQRRLPRLPRLKLRSVLLLHSGGKEAKGMSRHCCCNDYYYWLLQLSLQMCRKWIRTTSRGNWSVGAAQTAAAIAASVSALVLQTLRGYVAVRQAVLRGSVECVNTMLSFKRCFLFRWWRRLRCLQFRWTRSR